MKKSLLSLLFFLLLIPQLHSQDKEKKGKVYVVWVTKMDGSEEKGFFYEANEDGIAINKSKTLNESNLILVEVANINTIKIRRRGAVGKGAGIGLLAGAGLGIISGYASGDDPQGFLSSSKEDKAVFLGVSLGLLGSGLGAVIGTTREKIVINGGINAYKYNLELLKSRSLVKD